MTLIYIHPKEFFIEALFTIAKLWNQPRCPTTNEWIMKVLYIYTMEYYSAINKNEIMSFARKWIELEIIIVEQNKPISERQISHIFAYMQDLDLIII
jgi:hypothetical protein